MRSAVLVQVHVDEGGQGHAIKSAAAALAVVLIGCPRTGRDRAMCSPWARRNRWTRSRRRGTRPYGTADPFSRSAIWRSTLAASLVGARQTYPRHT